ncbi:MAG: hemerythrin family protein [Clostridiaceae bacterium]|nr:hemerythrin family protein [Clostridiaceae bacterium]
MYFEWRDEYHTGIDAIDKQHRHLLGIGARIFELAQDDEYDRYDDIMEVLQELKEYTVYHFGYEEELMERYGYERYEPHKFQHFFLTKKIEKFEEEKHEIDDRQKETILKLAEFISDWVTNHILKEDMLYRDFFRSKGL